MRWRIYYDDGHTFDDEQGKACDAPSLGVICVVQSDPGCGRMILTGYDYYICLGDDWLGVDLFGLLDYALNRLERIRGVVAGRAVANDVYTNVMRHAQDDPDFAAKSARRANEQPSMSAGRIITS
jgi:hypothetical protein